MRSQFQGTKGVVSVYVLVLTSLYLTFALTLIGLELGAQRDSHGLEDDEQATLLARSALHEARYIVLRTSPGWTGSTAEQTVDVAGRRVGAYRYTVAKLGNAYDLTGIGAVPGGAAPGNVVRSLIERVHLPIPQVLLYDGFESGTLAAFTEVNDAGTDWDVSTLAPDNTISVTPSPVFGLTPQGVVAGIRHARGVRTATGTTTRIARLLSPVMDLSGYPEVVLRFSYREAGGRAFRVSTNMTGNPVTGWVQIFNDGSNTWAGAWVRPATRLVISNPTSTFQFRFEATTDAAGQAWYLDRVELVAPHSKYDPNADT